MKTRFARALVFLLLYPVLDRRNRPPIRWLYSENRTDFSTPANPTPDAVLSPFRSDRFL
ncbi:hypothetical protein [Larkinella ripae]